VAAALSIAIAASWGCGQSVADKEKTEILGVGTMFVAALQNTVDTGQNKVGDAVTLRTLEDVRVNEITIVPIGSTIRGSVTHIDPAGRIAGGAELTMRFTELVTADGKSYPISCGPFRLKGKGDAKESVLQVGALRRCGRRAGGRTTSRRVPRRVPSSVPASPSRRRATRSSCRRGRR
jgi:hypothetical protein